MGASHHEAVFLVIFLSLGFFFCSPLLTACIMHYFFLERNKFCISILGTVNSGQCFDPARVKGTVQTKRIFRDDKRKYGGGGEV